MVTVRSATKSDRHAITQTWVKAFTDDPVNSWLRDSGANIARMFTVMQRWDYTPGDIDVALDTGRIVACARWRQPGLVSPPLIREVVSLPLWVWALRSAFPQGSLLVHTMDQARPEGPYLYLGTLGADERGKGYGSALLTHRLAGYDGRVYLESSNEENIPLYERFGFRVTQELQIPGGPKLWPMLRE